MASLLEKEPDRALAEIRRLPPRRAVSPLVGLFCHGDERVRWGAVRALGEVTARLAAEDPEAARVVVRRLMWSLNDESGGIGWGAPEAMGEILARHEGLAEEYAPILVSYIREDGNFLEYPPLQRGALWGVGRLAEARPDLARALDAGRHAAPFLRAADPALRGLAAWVLAGTGPGEARAALEALREDGAVFRLFRGGRFEEVTVGRLAEAALDGN
nr:DVU0298 family protein [Dissulfurirhabdus thermomarina]